MRFPALAAAGALAAGASLGLLLPDSGMAGWSWLAAGAVASWQVALVAFAAHRGASTTGFTLGAILLAGATAAQHADWQRQHPALRALVASPHARPLDVRPLIVEGRLREDAEVSEAGVTLRLHVDRVHAETGALALSGGIVVTVIGAFDPTRVATWTRGRRVRLAATLRRPTRYLNAGVPDADRASLRRGTALVGTVKSAALVEVVAVAPRWEEALARLRARVRRAMTAAMPDDASATAVVTAILIGDRGGLSRETERRLQRAGTYHVIAISGGNVAVFAMLAWTLSVATLRSRRLAGISAMLIVAAYGFLVASSASVGRAVVAALLLLGATVLHHRSPPLNVLGAVALLFLAWDPLALLDLGFLLSFGATAGILLATPVWTRRLRQLVLADGLCRRVLRSVLALVLATAAAELVLLPVQAMAFQRLTAAGFLLNLVAIPAMALAQVAGITVVVADLAGADTPMQIAGVTARAAARALLDSARVIDLVPALTWRVPLPPLWVAALYASSLAVLAWRPPRHIRSRMAGAGTVAMIAGATLACPGMYVPLRDGRLRLTVFDVGQSEAILLRLPSGRAALIDASGTTGGDGVERFDIGGRVLVPAVLARRASRVDWLLVTHPDLDHAGGALAVMADLAPSRIFEGIAPARHASREAIVAAAASSGMALTAVRRGMTWLEAGVLIRVLHPPEPEWERQAVRNGDSVALEVLFGSVSMVLTGDAGEPEEAEIAAALRPARVRLLKVGHHGSRSATSDAFLNAARPDVALVSAGRGNIYGHPSPVVIARLRRRGAATFRTDRDGQLDVVTDGRTLEVRTWTGERWAITAR